MTKLRAELGAAFRAHTKFEIPPMPGRTNHLPAGILVPLVLSDDRVELLVTERTAHLRQNPGELCFPGGRPDPADAGSLRRTALREANEEIGVANVDVLGELSSMPLALSDYRLFPFAGVVDPREVRPCDDEVAAIHRVDVRTFLDLPELAGFEWKREGSPVQIVPIFEVAGLYVYGGTAAVLAECLTVVARVMGRTMPPARATLSVEDVFAHVRRAR